MVTWNKLNKVQLYDPIVGQFFSPDELASERPVVSPYAYASNDPVNRVDPTGMWDDEYGLDTRTGRLSLIKTTDDDFDLVIGGMFDEELNFTANNKINSVIRISKGILNARNVFQDLSQEGYTTTGGNQEEGIDLMYFISTQVGKELSGIGFVKYNFDAELTVGAWDKNTTRNARPIEFDQNGIALFDIHTHPIGLEGNPGLGWGTASKDDLDRIPIYLTYYILSE